MLLAFCAGSAFGTAGTHAAAAASAAGSTRWLVRWLTRARFTLLGLSYALMLALHRLALATPPPAPTPTSPPGGTLEAAAVTSAVTSACELDEYEARCA